MRSLILLLLVCPINSVFAQNEANKIEHKGFLIGVGLGAGTLSLTTNDTTTLSFSTSLPNIKVGWFINQRVAVLALLPGANYKFKQKDRGFEGLLIGGQYWLNDKCWVLGGAGLSFDAAAFYTVDDPKTAEFNTGFPAVAFALSYQVWSKGRFSIDVQYRTFYGNVDLANNGNRHGISNKLLLGFNWY